MPAIKTRNFSLSKEKQNHTITGPNDLGWGPGYAAKSEGLQTPADRIRYSKGYSLMVGTCKKCDNNNGSKKAGGGHCDLSENEGCIF